MGPAAEPNPAGLGPRSGPAGGALRSAQRAPGPPAHGQFPGQSKLVGGERGLEKRLLLKACALTRGAVK